MPANTSPLDIVPVSIIKLCIDTFVPIIVRLTNLSFAEGRFPEYYKTAQVAPLLKKHVLDATQESCAGQNGSSKPPSDFEPEHHLQNTGKISAGSASHHQLRSRNLSALHFSYRAGHSTETSLLAVLNDMYAAGNDKKFTAVIALDLSAAFDTTSRIKYCSLACSLILGSVQLLQSYLTDRKQFVKIGRHAFIARQGMLVRCAARVGARPLVICLLCLAGRRNHHKIWDQFASICR